MNRRVFSGSRINRDRREQSFARAVIAAAECRRRQEEEVEQCLFCHVPLVSRDVHPYCSKECGLAAEME